MKIGQFLFLALALLEKSPAQTIHGAQTIPLLRNVDEYRCKAPMDAKSVEKLLDNYFIDISTEHLEIKSTSESVYYIWMEKKTFDLAQLHCLSLGATLVTVDSDEEYRFLKNIKYIENYFDNYFWVWLRKKPCSQQCDDSNCYRWKGNGRDPVKKTWWRHSNKQGACCVRYKPGQGLYQMVCNKATYFICERPFNNCDFPDHTTSEVITSVTTIPDPDVGETTEDLDPGPDMTSGTSVSSFEQSSTLSFSSTGTVITQSARSTSGFQKDDPRSTIKHNQPCGCWEPSTKNDTAQSECYTPGVVVLGFAMGLLAGIILVIILLWILHKTGKFSVAVKVNSCYNKRPERYETDHCEKQMAAENMGYRFTNNLKGDAELTTTPGNDIYDVADDTTKDEEGPYDHLHQPKHTPKKQTNFQKTQGGPEESYDHFKPVPKVSLSEDCGQDDYDYFNKTGITKQISDTSDYSVVKPRNNDQNDAKKGNNIYTKVNRNQPNEHNYLKLEYKNKLPSEETADPAYFTLEPEDRIDSCDYEKASAPISLDEPDASQDYFVLEKQ